MKLITLFAMLAFSSIAVAMTPESVKERYNEAVAKANADYKVARKACNDFAGNRKDVCVEQAKANEVKAKADAKVERVVADSNKTAKVEKAAARKDAATEKLDADYKVAREKCDFLAGDAKATCVAAAKKRFAK